MIQKTPGLLVLVRHGKSEYNLKNIFTGWLDSALAPKGKEEAHKAAELLKEYRFDMAFTSKLKRAQDTLKIILEDMDQQDIPTLEDQALNERHYGDLQGQNKEELKKKVGEKQVQLWRRSFDVAPPNGESLKDTCERSIPYLINTILPEVQSGKNIIVAAHGNSLRSIVKHLENISDEKIVAVEIPTGVPYIYSFDTNMNIANKNILHHDTLEEEKESSWIQ